jgi:glycosyltransferase involved in cell wall biosynthesis
VRVALVHLNVNFGGSLPRDTAFLARSLASMGVDVHCYCDPGTSSAELDQVTFHAVRPVQRGWGHRLRRPTVQATFALRATQALRRDRTRYDIVEVSGHCGWEHDVVRAHAVVRADQRRWPERGGHSFRGARLRAAAAPVLRPQVAVDRTIERLQYRQGRYARVLAVTEEVRQDLQEVHGVPAELIDLIPYAIDTERFGGRADGALHRLLGLPDDAVVALFVGHDFKRKGLAEAVEALVRVPGSVHLVIAGQAEQAPFAGLATTRGVGDRVHFLGGTDRPEELFRAADLFLLPTREDVWGITIIEAMAAGLPVVTTAVAGAAEEVRRARAGMVLRSGTPSEIAEAVSVVARDPEGRREMGQRGRPAAARFSLESHARAVLSVYERVVAERG